MAITVNSKSLSNGQPSAPLRAVTVNVDLDNSYPAGGYDISDQLEGGQVVHSIPLLHFDSSALRWLEVGTDNKVKCFVNTSGAKGVETSGATDVSGHTGVELRCFVE